MKYLGAVCGSNRLLFNLVNVVEVVEIEDFKYHPAKPRFQKALEPSAYKNVLFQVNWRDRQIDYIDLVSLFEDQKETCSRDITNQQFIVTAPEEDIASAEFQDVLAFGVSRLDQLLEVDQEQISDNLNFSHPSLRLLFSRAYSEDSETAPLLSVNLPVFAEKLVETLIIQAACT